MFHIIILKVKIDQRFNFYYAMYILMYDYWNMEVGG